MRVQSWLKIGLVAAVFAFSALADHGDDNHGNNNQNNNNNQNQNQNQNQNNNGGMFSSSMLGSLPGATIGGIMSGGVPWTISEGHASISSNGSVQVEVQGLLIAAGAPANLVGTVGPVQMVAASVVCGGSGGTVAGSTGGTFFSAGGNAEIQDTVTLPSSCMAPVVLVRIFNPAVAPGGQLGPFIAATGLSTVGNMQPGNNNNDNDGNDH